MRISIYCLLLTGLTLFACNKNVDEGATLSSRSESLSAPISAADPGALQGVVNIAPHLAEQAKQAKVLFLIARSGNAGPPMAVKKIAAPTFPLQFRLTAQDAMIEGASFSGSVVVTARLDQDGSAGPASSGDLIGTTAQPVMIGGAPCDILINQTVP